MYFQGSSEPVDHGQLQTLHLMKPNYYVTFSEDTQSHHQDNTDLLFNPTTINTSMAHQQQFVGFTSSLVHHQRQDQEDHVHNNIPRLYNHSVLGLAYQHGNQTNMAQSVSPQALSLSLSPHKIITEALQKSNTNMNHTIGQDLHEKSTNFYSSDHTLAAATGFSYPVQGVILGSKYLKAAQELLDEMASVGKATKIIDEVKDKAKNVIIKHQSNDEAGAAVHELTTAQRQEMQMKKAKLNIMLDEVDQRCRQYHHQMQITISWFERETGIGSSRSYTQLALKTILKQFKRLKSAIISQIKSINKSLGEEHNSGETFQQGSRLKFIDHQLRQRRSSLQENAWRPQRGLPEAAVSVLRAWLFEHFLHPYPKDSDKIMMAKQTGLTRSQVSNWFINARVRLWKPMVEEMYLEETKNQEQANDHKDSSSSSDQDKNIKQSHHDHNQVVTTDALQPNKDQHHENPTSHLVRSPTADISPSSVTISASLLLPQLTSTPLKFPEKINNLKRPRNMIEKNQENSPSSILSSAEMEMKDHSTMIGNDKGLYGIHRHDYLSTLNMNSDHHHVSSGFGNYGIGELSRFNTQQIQANNSQGNDNNSNNGNFSLSLALPPSSGNYHMSSHRNSFEFGIGGIDNQIGASRVDNHGVMNNDDRSSHPSVGVNYEVLDFYNRSKRYASHQMLPDFVA